MKIISIIFCYISIIKTFSSLYYQSFFYIFRSSGPKPLKFGLYQDSGRSWINHNGGEIIFDLDKHIVPGTWNTFCYNCDPNGTFQIFANGYTLRKDKYTQSMEHFDLQSPILLGGNSESDAEKHRFFGEISDFNILSGKLEDKLRSTGMEGNSRMEICKHHIRQISGSHQSYKRNCEEQESEGEDLGFKGC